MSLTPSDRTVASEDVVAAARRLGPQIRAAREKTEELRQTPSALADAIAKAGLYQLYLPRSVGGPEVTPLIAFSAIEELSRADGSVGWCAMISSGLSFFVGFLAPGVGQGMCGNPANIRIAGALRPQGRCWPVDGGYRVKGQWDFASGIHNANWLYCTCVVMDGDKPEMTPAGTPRVRVMWIPVSAAAIKDTWSVMGMRGTGSQDFVIDDIIVPNERTFFAGEPAFETGPQYQPRGMLAILWATTVGNALGIARGAIDDFVEIATREGSSISATLLRDRPLVQARVAESEAILNAARAYVIDAVRHAWEALSERKTDPAHDIAQARLAIAHGMNEAVRSVDLVFRVAGTNAIHTRNPLERHFRDIHVAVQHIAAFPVHYESAGKVLMGLRPGDPGW